MYRTVSKTLAPSNAGKQRKANMTTANLVKIEGNTRPFRAKLKKLGAIYRPDSDKSDSKKSWYIAADMLDRANSIVSGQHDADRAERIGRAKASYYQQLADAAPARKCMACGADLGKAPAWVALCPACK